MAELSDVIIDARTITVSGIGITFPATSGTLALTADIKNTFISLTDTPSAYGLPGQAAIVNPAQNSLNFEFVSSKYVDYVRGVVDNVSGALNALYTTTDSLSAAIGGDIDTTLTYVNGILETKVTAIGVQTYNYDISGRLTSISGTGQYPTKSLTYDPSGNLTHIEVI